MIYSKLSDLTVKLYHNKKKIIAVAAAHDFEVLETINEAYKKGIAESILVGDHEKILNIIQQQKYDFPVKIINEKDEKLATLIATELVKNAEADILMKGQVNSSDFLKAVLHEEKGLRTNKILSHLAVFEVPNFNKLMFYSDGGMNVLPKLETKVHILNNAVEALNILGIKKPNVAILSANEKVSDKMPSTLDAASLVEMNKNGIINNCVVEGPIALDVALSIEAAKHKGINSKISGNVDLFIVPTIDAGNIVGKALIYCAQAKMAGVILGAKNPIVMTSRAENVEGKLNSIILACAIAIP